MSSSVLCISTPILNILPTIFAATSQPVLIAGSKELDASWLRLSMSETPSLNHYRSADLMQDVWPRATTSRSSVRDEFLDLWQHSTCNGHILGEASTREDLEMLDQIISRRMHPLIDFIPLPIFISSGSIIGADKLTEVIKANHQPLRRLTFGNDAGNASELINAGGFHCLPLRIVTTLALPPSTIRAISAASASNARAFSR